MLVSGSDDLAIWGRHAIIQTELDISFNLNQYFLILNYNVIQSVIQNGGKMKSITIHGIDGPLERLIKSRARSEGLSVNKTLKKLLEESLGAKPRGVDAHRGDFEEFCGIWKDEDLAYFENKTKDLREVNPEDWQ